MAIKLIVGLANPGNKYTDTRHNVGSWYIKLLADQYCQTLKEDKKFLGYTGRIFISKNNIYLLIPTTFINFSGKAVTAIADFYNIVPKDILIVHDEMNLLPGRLRLKLGGGHGGHNGIKDVINCLGKTSKFYRLSIGIGHPGDKTKVVNFVLGKPTILERQLIDKAIDVALHCTNILITQDINRAIHCLNFNSSDLHY